MAMLYFNCPFVHEMEENIYFCHSCEKTGTLVRTITSKHCKTKLSLDPVLFSSKLNIEFLFLWKISKASVWHSSDSQEVPCCFVDNVRTAHPVGGGSFSITSSCRPGWRRCCLVFSWQHSSFMFLRYFMIALWKFYYIDLFVAHMFYVYLSRKVHRSCWSEIKKYQSCFFAHFFQ